MPNDSAAAAANSTVNQTRPFLILIFLPDSSAGLAGFNRPYEFHHFCQASGLNQAPSQDPNPPSDATAPPLVPATLCCGPTWSAMSSQRDRLMRCGLVTQPST